VPPTTLSESRLVRLYDHVCCGNPEALRFLFNWNLFCHGIDDIIDDTKRTDPEEVIAAFAQANIVYSLPFYQANAARLQTTIMLVTNAYADSVAWEKSPNKGHQSMADVLRFAGNEMVFAVALICGGYRHMRAISASVREFSWDTHHTETGEAK
jgi:hypothetical protein